MSSLLDLNAAQARFLGHFHPLGPERIAPQDAVGRVIAEPQFADVDMPPFDTTAMDGWATVDLESPPAGWPAIGVVAAAPGLPPPLPVGAVMKVMTGAPLPAGTTAVVPVEEAEEVDGKVRFRAPALAGQHVRRRGEVLGRGDLLFAAGHRLSTRDAGLAAAASGGSLAVYRRPRVAILVTGDELVDPGQVLGPGQLRESNGVFLQAAAKAAGAEVEACRRIGDDRAAIARELGRLVALRPDLVLTSGGVSMGDFDHGPGAIADLGGQILFHGLAIKPAKPVLAATLREVPILALPGNPVSVAVAWRLLALPALRLLSGREAEPAPLIARLVTAVRNPSRRRVYRDAHWWPDAGTVQVEALKSRGSHDLAAHARANGLIVVPMTSELAAGDPVEVVDLTIEA